LTWHVPTGFIFGYEGSGPDHRLAEFVPAGESVHDWSEMISVTMRLGHPITLEQLLAGFRTARDKRARCENGEVEILAREYLNGYDTLTFTVSCAYTVITGKPEFSWHKAIRGNDRLYVIAKSFSYKPEVRQIAAWMEELKLAVVCDTRLADRPCPKRTTSRSIAFGGPR